MMNAKQYLEKPPISYWISSTEKTNYPSLNEDIKVDVAIIGGGIAGIMTGYQLSMEGVKVAILEANKILMGTTGHTTAKLTSQHELIYDKMKTQMGFELAQQYANANETAIKIVEQISAEHNIDCDFSRQDAFCFTQNEENIEKIKNEVDAASDLGISADYVEQIPFHIPIKAAVRFHNQAQYHPRKFLLPLAKEIVNKGNYIFENSRVVEVEENSELKVITDKGFKVSASKIILASHYPFLNKEGFYFARLYVERDYAVAIRAKEKYPGGMYINAEDPARSLRNLPGQDGELILVVGENHKSGQGEDTINHYYALIDFASENFTIEDIPYRWSAQDCMTLDGIPYVGNFSLNTPDIYVATGYCKWGMSNAIASSVLLKDLIVHGDSPWKDVYSPSRATTGSSIGKFIVENANVVGNLLKGKLSSLPDDVDLKPGEAQVVNVDGYRAGAYKDGEGKIHIVDTTCTHLGCEVNWNSAEKSWDCPCHGSRFAYTGEVIEGPANKSLNTEENTNIIERVATDKF
jgi:glycine/D-amino acid oxidase-like deaminating enzyme/nitrite reductase/ring-hydroxylating ferredoxin subunit